MDGTNCEAPNTFNQSPKFMGIHVVEYWVQFTEHSVKVNRRKDGTYLVQGGES